MFSSTRGEVKYRPKATAVLRGVISRYTHRRPGKTPTGVSVGLFGVCWGGCSGIARPAPRGLKGRLDFSPLVELPRDTDQHPERALTKENHDEHDQDTARQACDPRGAEGRAA